MTGIKCTGGLFCARLATSAGNVRKRRNNGLTLVELLIAMTVAMIVMGSVCSVYVSHVKISSASRQRLALQQNLRGAMAFLTQEMRAAGFDPEQSGRFGIVDVRRYGLERTGEDPNGQPALFYTVDMDENGALDERNHNRNREHCSFRIRHDLNTGRRYLAWDNGSGRRPVAENISMLGFAYGVDADGDGRIDTWNGGAHTIWAVDSDNDNLLDLHIDANNDGIIDADDDVNQDGRIGPGDGGRIDPPVSLERVRAVRVWLLARSTARVAGHVDGSTYVVGDRVYKSINDGFLRRVSETIVKARNL